MSAVLRPYNQNKSTRRFRAFTMIDMIIGVGLTGILMAVIVEVTKMGKATMVAAETTADSTELTGELMEIINNPHQMTCNLMTYFGQPLLESNGQPRLVTQLGVNAPPITMDRIAQFRCPNATVGGVPNKQMIVSKNCTCVDPSTGRQADGVTPVRPRAIKVLFSSCGAGTTCANFSNDPLVDQTRPNLGRGNFIFRSAILSAPRAASSLYCSNKPADSMAGTNLDCNCPINAATKQYDLASCAAAQDYVVQSHAFNLDIVYYRINSATTAAQIAALMALDPGAPGASKPLRKSVMVPLEIWMNRPIGSTAPNILARSNSM